MKNVENDVADHYSRGDLEEALFATQGRREGLGTDDLKPYDEFHIGGRPATEHFMARLGFDSDMDVLDVGSGLGGPARYVAENYGARVSGIDITAEFVKTAGALSAATNLDGQTAFYRASALNLPFAGERFDLAYMIHVGMNIADKAGMYAEIARVLRPGGRLGIYDILRGPQGGRLIYPVPWAETEATSFPASPAEMRSLLEDAGFEIMSMDSREEFAREALAKMRQSENMDKQSISHRPGFAGRVTHLEDNVKAGRCVPWEIVATKAQ